MKRVNVLIICLCIFLGIQIGFAQSSQVDLNESRRREEMQREERQRRIKEDLARRGENLRTLEKTQVQTTVLSKEQRARNSDRATEIRENSALIKKMSAVPSEYYGKYEKLLRNKKVGIFRIFPDKGCYEGKTTSARELEKCADAPPVKGGGSYYSFRLKSNSNSKQDWWDAHFVDDKFVIGNATVQGIIAEIGEVDLEDVKSNSKAFEFLSDYKHKNTVREIKKVSEVLEKGVNSNGFSYSNNVQIKLNSTYAARIIAYQLKSQRTNGAFIGLPSGQLDITLTFKVVGMEKDASLIILWKELKTDLTTRGLTEN